jgi:hypothetical protein
MTEEEIRKRAFAMPIRARSMHSQKCYIPARYELRYPGRFLNDFTAKESCRPATTRDNWTDR